MPYRDHVPEDIAGSLRRLREELGEAGLVLDLSDNIDALVLEEIDGALRPPTHERRVPSRGTIIEPQTDPSSWAPGTELDITRAPLRGQPLDAARRYTDGISSWLLRRIDGEDEWVVFDRPAGSERDLVVVAEVFDATLVQRHPAAGVRVVGSFGVLRWQLHRWHYEPPVARWFDAKTACTGVGDRVALRSLLEFAVHDLGALGIGALLVYGPDEQQRVRLEPRLPEPPPLDVHRATHLAPLRHALAQVDGAAIFDEKGVLRHLGVRLVPSADAEATVEGLGGMRHTSARRYSRDDPQAVVVVVSEDGPVTIFRDGDVVARSR